MKKCLFVLFVIMTGFSTFVQAQSKVTRKPQRVTHKSSAQKQNGVKTDASQVVFDVIEEQPQYPGGPSAMMSYLSANIKYPEEAAKNGIQGRVVVTFIIEKDGSVSEPTVVKGVDPSLDMEAVRVIMTMPKWVPGKQNGQPVRCKFTVPIQFSFGSEAKHVGSDVVEEQPQYPGGVNGLMSYLNKNVKYPKEAAENGIQGRVVVAFTVEMDGSVSEPTVVKSVDPSLDMEAVRVVSGMPKWTPGKQNGQPVRCKITIPVQFSLQ